MSFSLGKPWLLLILAVSFLGCESKPKETEVTALQSLQKVFGESVAVKKNGSLIIEFCPDNTCEIFRTPNTNALEPISDFAYLYLFFVSQYYYLTDWKKNPEAKIIAIDILKRNRACPETQEKAWGNCVLKSLSSKHSIKVAFVRYDEQVRSEESINLEAELSKSAQAP